jgi:hypothetical protein
MFMVENEIGEAVSRVLPTREDALGDAVRLLMRAGDPMWVVDMRTAGVEIVRPLRNERGDLVGVFVERGEPDLNYEELAAAILPVAKVPAPRELPSYIRVIK